MANLHGQTNTNQTLTGGITAKNPLSGNILAKGNPGKDGKDGTTPRIGENGNWFIGEIDTGVQARGSDGAPGKDGNDGVPGKDGKSAYDYAKDGGYTGTEEEFAAKLAKEETISNKAKKIVESVKGSDIVITDSDNEPLQGLKLFGKSEQNTIRGNQLIPYPFSETTKTANGVTFTDEGDGWISVSGTSTDKSAFLLVMDGALNVNNGDEITIHSEIVGSVDKLFITGWTSTWGKFLEDRALSLKAGASVTGKITSNIVKLQISVEDIDVNFDGKIRVMLNKGTTALPYESYVSGIQSPSPQYPQEIISAGDDGKVEVDVYSNNLLKLTCSSQTIDGVDFIVNNDSSITVKGTATSNVQLYLNANWGVKNNIIVSKKDLFVGGGLSESIKLNVYLFSNGNWMGTFYSKGGAMLVLPANKISQYDGIAISLYISSGTKVDTTIYPMMTTIENNTYEPYNKQSLTIPTPNGLPAIKVTDAAIANYTDQYGDMYCCDEIDFERGVYIQRVWKGKPNKTINFTQLSDTNQFIVWDGTLFPYRFKNIAPCMSSIATYSPYANTINTLCLAGTGMYYKNGMTSLEEVNSLFADLGTNIVFVGVLETPIETPLSTEELEQYKTIHTNYPTTTILSDAQLEVNYVADTKNYIDKKFAELQTALVAMGG